MKIAFQTPQLDIRGTCTAIYDYAKYNESLLNNISIIVVPESGKKTSDDIAIEKFSSKFTIYYYTDFDDLENYLINYNCDVLYMIKYGKNDNIYSKKIKTVIHCVFDMTEPHGNIYAGVSSTLAKKFGKTLFVPHICGLESALSNENLRSNLNIPEDSIVFGRHGGMDTFDLMIAMKAIIKTVLIFKNIYFIFVNTPKFFIHPQIIYLDKFISDQDKNKFILSCDAYICGCSLGQTFGLSIAEFSINNKPIICYNTPQIWNKAHIEILQDKGIYYDSEDKLFNILTTFDPKQYSDKDMNCYKDYSPDKVMKIFKKVFLD